MKVRIACAVTLMLGAWSGAAQADDWGQEVDGWTVGRSNDTCVMTMEFEGEGATSLSLATDDENAADTYVSVTNYGWSAEKGKIYELKFGLGEWVYTQPAVGVESSIIRKGFVIKVADDFLQDFGKSSGLTIRLGDTLVDDLSLKGSSAGLSVFERCRRDVARDLDQKRRDAERLAHIPKDPFAAKPEE